MTKIRLQVHRRLVLLITLLLLVSTTFLPATATPLQAQSTAQPTVQTHLPDAVAITTTDTALTITWPNPALVSASAVDVLQQLPRIRFQGYLLPMRLFTVEVEDGQSLDLQVQNLAAQPWTQPLVPAEPLTPLAVDWETQADLSQAAETIALPAAPLFVLRQGNLHGKQIAVIAVSPLYAEAGVTKVATTLAAQAPQARLVDGETLQAAATAPRTLSNAQDQSAVAPVNADALRQAIKVLVREVGLQAVTGAALATAGLDLNQVDPSRLQMRHNGAEIALQVEGLVGGKLTPTATLRFYAPHVGDRWNAQETYWLTEGDGAGLRMTTRPVTPGAATARSTALEQGQWEENLVYDSRYEGADGDHWFHSNLLTAGARAAATAAPTETTTAATAATTTASATLTPRLPRVAETAVYTVGVTTNIRGQHTLRVKIGNDQRDVNWSSVPANELVYNWQHVVSSTVQSNLLDIVMLVTPTTDDKDAIVLLDQVAWQAPVQLNFGGNGAQFIGVAGEWRYQWSNLPAGYAFYDVTAATTPTILTGAEVSGFQDGPAPRIYLVAGPSDIHTPTVVAHTPITLTGANGADAIYLGPSQFLGELGPLLQLRRDQGYQVATVDVQAIYDGWNFGQVSAEAIRLFLRYAAANWQPAPHAVTLVGDGTVDPLNYEKRDTINFIPPYMAKVDPWLIEAACEPCYGQLNGDDPVTGDDPAGHFFASELWVGRLPVKNSGDLAGVINKIISYERATALEGWQNVNVFVADNYIKSVDNSGLPVKDLAGDFAKIADGIVDLMPTGVREERIYFDPYPQFSDPGGAESWRIGDAAQARNAVIAQLSTGAGLVTYNGHSHHWQWAITDERPNADPNWLLGLYDTDLLSNKNRYFVSLSMTCLTSQFQKPAFSGTVLDERLLLNPNGGAAAVWGPAGLSVAYGHDLLQRGFYEALWSAPPLTAKMGALIEAGNVALLTQGACCQDTLKTFLLLGDPLTTVRVYPTAIPELYLPVIRR